MIAPVRARRTALVAVAIGFAGAMIFAGANGCAHDPAAPPAAPAPPAAAPPSSAPGPAGKLPAGAPGPASANDEARFWEGRPDLIQPPPPPPAAELALPPVERWRLPNGLDVVAIARKGLPIISMSMAIKSGGYDEQKGRTEGVADFTAAMLRKGTRKRNADQIALAIDRVGGALDAQSSMESSSIGCSVLSKDAALCLDLLGEMLLRPTFPEPEMPEIRDQILAALAARTDDPHQLSAEHFDNLLFGEGHPDGWVLDEAMVQAIARPKLVEFWKRTYRPNNAMLAVAGDFEVATLKRAIAAAFAGWKAAPVPARPAFAIPPAQKTRALLIDKPDLTQATLMFGHPGIRHADPDWYAVTVMNYSLGGSDFSSRLMNEVRSKRGLTYGIGSSYGASLLQGAFRVSAATRNETAGDAWRTAVDELRKMKAGGPTAGELAKAKGYYAGSTPFALESAAGLAHGIVAAELHGLGLAYVRELAVRLAAVDLAAARAAAQAHLDPDHLAVVIVGRAAVVGPQLLKAGLPFETVDYRAPISAARRRAAASPTGGAPPPPAPAP